MEQFTALLVRTYSSAPLRAAAVDTEVLVRSTIRRPGVEALTLDYDMEDTIAGWKVYDVKIAGISLVIAYRESFAAMVREAGIDGLIRSLSEKNRQNARAETR